MRKSDDIMLNAKRSNPWHASGNGVIRCPHPDCCHTAEIITNAHCRMYHGMNRKEISELYGYPEQFNFKRSTL